MKSLQPGFARAVETFSLKIDTAGLKAVSSSLLSFASYLLGGKFAD